MMYLIYFLCFCHNVNVLFELHQIYIALIGFLAVVKMGFSFNSCNALLYLHNIAFLYIIDGFYNYDLMVVLLRDGLSQVSPHLKAQIPNANVWKSKIIDTFCLLHVYQLLFVGNCFIAFAD